MSYVGKLWASAIAGAAAAWAVKLTLPSPNPIVEAILVLGPYGLVFFAMTAALRIPESAGAVKRVLHLR